MWETNNVFRLKHAYYYVPVCVVLKIIFINSGQQKIVHMTCALMCGFKKKDTLNSTELTIWMEKCIRMDEFWKCLFSTPRWWDFLFVCLCCLWQRKGAWEGAHFEWCFIRVNIAQHRTDTRHAKKNNADWGFKKIKPLIDNKVVKWANVPCQINNKNTPAAMQN